MRGVTVSEDNENGALQYTLELNNMMLEHEIKLNQKVERMSQFSGSDVLSVPPSSSGTYSESEMNAILATKANTNHLHAELYSETDHVHGFLELTDTPDSYLGQGTKVVAVKADDSGLEFITVADSGSAGSALDYFIVFADDQTVSTRSERGVCVRFRALATAKIKGVYFLTDWTNGIVFTCKLWSSSNAVLVAQTIIGDGSTATRKTVLFDTPYTMTALSEYVVSIEIPSGSIKKYYGTALSTAFVTLKQSYSGVPLETLTAVSGVYVQTVILEI